MANDNGNLMQNESEIARPLRAIGVQSDCFLYFIQAESGGLIKVGFSNDPDNRLHTLQMSCPVKLEVIATCRGGLAEEKKLHRRFARSRVYGEWFRPVPTLMALIASFQNPEHEKVMAWAQLDSYMARVGRVKTIEPGGSVSYSPRHPPAAHS